MHQLWGHIFSGDRVIKFQWIWITIYNKTWATHSAPGLSLFLKSTCWLYLLESYPRLFTCRTLSHVPIPAHLYLSSWHQSSISLYLMPNLSTAFKTMSWKLAYLTICHPEESVGNNIHSFSKYLWNIHGAAVAGLDEGSQQLCSPPSGVYSLVYGTAGTLLNRAHAPLGIHWYMLLVNSSQRSIYIPLLTYLFPDLLALRYSWKTLCDSNFFWSQLITFQ